MRGGNLHDLTNSWLNFNGKNAEIGLTVVLKVLYSIFNGLNFLRTSKITHGDVNFKSVMWDLSTQEELVFKLGL